MLQLFLFLWLCLLAIIGLCPEISGLSGGVIWIKVGKAEKIIGATRGLFSKFPKYFKSRNYPLSQKKEEPCGSSSLALILEYYS